MLDDVAYQWQIHKIRPAKNQNSPNGKPVLMYTMPEMFGGSDYICSINVQKLAVADDICTGHASKCDETIMELCDALLADYGINKPKSVEDLCVLYVFLRNKIHDMLGCH